MSTTEKRLPTTLVEAIRYFSDEQVCIDFVAQLRWPDGPVCPRCEGTEHSYLTTRKLWKCKTCKKQFSVKVGSIFEDSPIKLKNWLTAIWLIANSKNGISSHELGRSIGLTQKSAWFVLHRIRLAMRTGTFEKFDGQVEADESWVGGKARNMHKAKAKKLTNRVSNKTRVVGAIERGKDGGKSRVAAEPMPSVEWDTPIGFVRRTAVPGATLYTDAAQMYDRLRAEYKHSYVDHSRSEYARGTVSTNGIENFWSLLKRGIFGTYVQVDPEHLWRYVDERVFTFNMRGMDDLGRFNEVLSRVAGRRLTWDQLTA